MWRPPTPQFYKLKINGSCSGNLGFDGIGGVIRDENSHFIAAVSSFLGICTNVIAKLIAIKKGLQLARDKQLQNHIIEIDSLVSL
ncbi:hypothetical protein REPUB_Repub12eG0017000 [Reevesia pubescens]